MSIAARLKRLEKTQRDDGRCLACPPYQPVRIVDDERELNGATLPRCDACGWNQADDGMIYFLSIAGLDLDDQAEADAVTEPEL